MTRLTRAWGVLSPEQRLATLAALALLITMFFPWYQLQSLDRKTGAIYSHSISAFGDVSFVEAAVFLVAAGVIALMFARAEQHTDFHMPGSDGTVVMAAGCWAALLIFYRVFSRPDGHGYPVGIQWGFFLAFVTAGALGFAGWRMRATSVPEAPLMRPRSKRGPAAREGATRPAESDEEATVVVPSRQRAERSVPMTARPADPSEDPTSVVAPSRRSPPRTTHSPPSPSRNTAPKRPRFPPPPSEQLSFEDQPEQDER